MEGIPMPPTWVIVHIDNFEFTTQKCCFPSIQVWPSYRHVGKAFILVSNQEQRNFSTSPSPKASSNFPPFEGHLTGLYSCSADSNILAFASNINFACPQAIPWISLAPTYLCKNLISWPLKPLVTCIIGSQPSLPTSTEIWLPQPPLAEYLLELCLFYHMLLKSACGIPAGWKGVFCEASLLYLDLKLHCWKLPFEPGWLCCKLPGSSSCSLFYNLGLWG